MSVQANWAGVTEVFASGTAAGVTPVREIVHEGKTLFEGTSPGPITERLSRALGELKVGKGTDRQGWLTVVEPRKDEGTPLSRGAGAG